MRHQLYARSNFRRSFMQKLLGRAVAIFFTVTAISLAATGDKDTIIKEEKTVWETVKSKSYDAFHKYLTDDYHGVYKEGIMNVEQEVAAIKKADLKSVSFSEMNVVFLDNDAVVVTYKVTVQGTQDGKDNS